MGEKVYHDGVSGLRAPRQMLHAWRLQFPHPIKGALVSAEAPLPADMASLCKALARGSN
jgi:23S rRNA pseudouridine1911/1915/1917 synthase